MQLFLLVKRSSFVVLREDNFKGTSVEKLHVMARFYLELWQLTHLWRYRHLLIPLKPPTQFSEFSLAWVRPSSQQTLFLGLLGFLALCPTWSPFHFPQAPRCHHLLSLGMPRRSVILHRSQQRDFPSSSSSSWELGTGLALPGRFLSTPRSKFVKPCLNKPVYSIVQQQTQRDTVLIFASTSQISKLII